MINVAFTAVAPALAAGAFGIGAGAHAGSRSPDPPVTRVVKVRDEGRLHFVSSSGSQLIDEGLASGTMPGRVRARFTYDGNPSVDARFTIYGHGWSISGRAAGRLSNPASPAPSFRGSLSLTGGSGRYAHARGAGELFGVFYRRSYGLVVQAIGKLHY